MKFNIYCILIIICISGPVFADSVKVGDILYENIYLEGTKTGYQIRFPETGEVRDVRTNEIDASSMVYSPPLERVKFLDSWENTPLQIKLKKELADNADQIEHQEKNEKELQMLREQQVIEQNKLDQKRRESEEMKRLQEENERKRKEAERRTVILENAKKILSVAIPIILLVFLCYLPTIIAVRRRNYVFFIFMINTMLLPLWLADLITAFYKSAWFSFLGINGEKNSSETYWTDMIDAYSSEYIIISAFAAIVWLGTLAWASWPKNTTGNNRNANTNPGRLAQVASVQDIRFKDSTISIYVHVSDQVRGPYTTEQIHLLMLNGSITTGSIVCQEGTQTWQPLSSFLK